MQDIYISKHYVYPMDKMSCLWYSNSRQTGLSISKHFKIRSANSKAVH